MDESRTTRKRTVIGKGSLRLIIGVVAASSVLIYFSVIKNSEETVCAVSIKGANIVSQSEVEAALGLSPDSPKKKIDLDSARRKIEAIPYVRAAYPSRSAGEKIKVQIEERTPIAALIDPSGRVSFADETGAFLPYRRLDEYKDLPVIRGALRANSPDSTALSGAIKLLNLMRETEFLYELCSEISYDDRSDSYKIILADGEVRVFVGTESRFIEKINKLEVFMRRKIQTLKLSDLDYIDLRWTDRVIVKNKDFAKK